LSKMKDFSIFLIFATSNSPSPLHENFSDKINLRTEASVKYISSRRYSSFPPSTLPLIIFQVSHKYNALRHAWKQFFNCDRNTRLFFTYLGAIVINQVLCVVVQILHFIFLQFFDCNNCRSHPAAY